MIFEPVLPTAFQNENENRTFDSVPQVNTINNFRFSLFSLSFLSPFSFLPSLFHFLHFLIIFKKFIHFSLSLSLFLSLSLSLFLFPDCSAAHAVHPLLGSNVPNDPPHLPLPQNLLRTFSKHNRLSKKREGEGGGEGEGEGARRRRRREGSCFGIFESRDKGGGFGFA